MRRYTAIASLFGYTYALMIYSYSCNLSYSDIVQIAQRDFNPACQVMSFKIEPPDFQSPVIPTTPNIHAVAATATVSTGTIY